MTKFDRVIKLLEWARARYRDKTGKLLLQKGHTPSKYRVIEDMAMAKYFDCPRHFPSHTLKTAVQKAEG